MAIPTQRGTRAELQTGLRPIKNGAFMRTGRVSI